VIQEEVFTSLVRRPVISRNVAQAKETMISEKLPGKGKSLGQAGGRMGHHYEMGQEEAPNLTCRGKRKSTIDEKAQKLSGNLPSGNWKKKSRLLLAGDGLYQIISIGGNRAQKIRAGRVKRYGGRKRVFMWNLRSKKGPNKANLRNAQPLRRKEAPADNFKGERGLSKKGRAV